MPMSSSCRWSSRRQTAMVVKQLTRKCALRGPGPYGAHVIAIELHYVHADWRGLHLGQLAVLDEDRQGHIRLGIRGEKDEPRVGRQIEAASAVLRRAGLAPTVSGQSRRAEPVVHVVRRVDL